MYVFSIMSEENEKKKNDQSLVSPPSHLNGGRCCWTRKIVRKLFHRFSTETLDLDFF